MAIQDLLPAEVAEGASLRDKEYGWNVSAFPNALLKAQIAGYACLGGQFQFRLDDGSTCEMYWLEANSAERADEESWIDYSRRSCAEVLKRFQHLVSETNFAEEASHWPLQIDSVRSLVFVAYFIRETEWADLSAKRLS